MATRWRVFRLMKTRLIAFALALVLLGLLVRILLLSGFLREEIEQLITAQQISQADYVAQDIDAKIRARQDLVRQLADHLPVDLLRRPDALQAWLVERQDLYPLFSSGLTVIDLAGIALADASPLEGRRGASYADRDWFKAVRNSGKSVMSPPLLGRISRQPSIVMAAPIKDGYGNLFAVLAGTTALAAPGFLDLVQEHKVGQSGGFLVVSPQDRIFVTASNPELTLRPLPAPGANPLHDRAMAGYRGGGLTVNAQGKGEISAIASIPAANWFLVASTPAREAFAPIDRLYGVLLRNTLLIGIVVVLSALIVLNWLFRPLTHAAQQVNAMAAGRIGLRALPVVRNDEVGDLAAGFNLLLGKLRDREAILARIAHHDPLTALPNRSTLLDRLNQSIALAQRRHSRLALLFLDLDGFKSVNDDHGHDAGDRLLHAVAQRLRGTVRKADMVARFGGDEFVILLTDIGDAASAERIADKCLAALAPPVAVDKLQLTIGASIGIALYPDHADNASSLLACADAAMYDAKRSGRNSCRLAPLPENT